MPVFPLLAQKAFRRNLQYRASHVVTNVASLIFGFIYIAVWQAATARGGTGDYAPVQFSWYVAFNQAMLWITIFREHGLGIPESVYSGAVALDMMRPIDYHAMMVAREFGNVWYSFWFRTVPLFIAFTVVIGMHVPRRPETYLLLAAAILLAVYVGLCLHYVAGIAAFWTIQSRWLSQILHTAHTGLSGFMVPVELLPGIVAPIAAASPFAALQYYPARIYLELSGAEALRIPLLWAALLTVICRLLTRLARRKLEIQGG